jgi:hypothetical protein
MPERFYVFNSTKSRVLAVVTTAVLAAGAFAGSSPAFAEDILDPGDRLFVNPNSTTLQAAAALTGQARADAQLLGSFASANWFTKGTPAQVKAEVNAVVTAAAADGSVPVLVAYNLPFRDCAQYSAGGAANTAAYNAWIDAFAAGVGNRDAVVILEPDGLGIIPWYTTVNGAEEWCKPEEADAATAASDRFIQLNHAVDAFAALAKTAVYLDGTHSGWLGVGDISDRLRSRTGRRVLPQRVELRGDRAPHSLRQLDLRLRVPVDQQLVPATVVRKPVLPGQPGRPVDLGSLRRRLRPGVRRHGPRAQRGGAEALRHRHEPQWPGTVDASRRRLHRRRGLVQPSRSGARPAADHHDGQRPHRCVPLDQGAGRV